MKFVKYLADVEMYNVVPHAGTWIEIFIQQAGGVVGVRRSPRGNVD